MVTSEAADETATSTEAVAGAELEPGADAAEAPAGQGTPVSFSQPTVDRIQDSEAAQTPPATDAAADEPNDTTGGFVLGADNGDGAAPGNGAANTIYTGVSILLIIIMLALTGYSAVQQANNGQPKKVARKYKFTLW